MEAPMRSVYLVASAALLPLASAFFLVEKYAVSNMMYPSSRFFNRLITPGSSRVYAPIHRQFGSADRLPRSLDKNLHIAIVGGGLAGLSVAYQLLEKTKGEIQLTIIDKARPGEGGASSVAGGLLHPFSPRGKLIHMGMEGLESSARLIEIAQQFQPECVLRDRLYRVALSDENVKQLMSTANTYPELASWLGPEDIEKFCGARSVGGLALTGGCKVIHVPSYLKGLWEACRDISSNNAQWILEKQDDAIDWKDRLSGFDTVVFAAGSGMFQDYILRQDTEDFPAEMVRGQSIEMSVPESYEHKNEAVLCGKYIAPMIEKKHILIGATHEYKAQAMSEQEVWDELKGRSYELSPDLWDLGRASRITSGYRVQSKRGKYGRMPIIGRSCGDIHDDAWLCTGLSSRGLIYHGIFGDLLTDSIVAGDENAMLERNAELLWWKKR